jgi:kynurenine formamidase
MKEEKLSVNSLTSETLTEGGLSAYMSQLSNWGRWGVEDELGTLNHIDASRVLQGALSAKSGRVVSCGRPISSRMSAENPSPLMHHMLSSGTESPSEGMHSAFDWFGMGIHGHSFTHLDSHGHVFWNGMQYNGRRADTVETLRGATKGSIAPATAGIVTRGVLLDIPRVLGRSYLDPGEAISPEVLEQCEEAQGLKVSKGDALLVRVGRDARPSHVRFEARAGLHARCLPWLHDREISVLGSDSANDVSPSGFDLMRVPIHVVGIVAMGLWLLDNADLEGLAKACALENRWSFQFFLAPLAIKNATGSPVNPIAVL